MTSPGTVDDGARLRLFCGLTLPDVVLDPLLDWQRREIRHGSTRPVSRENVHITLAFLGDRPAGDAEPVAGALREAVAAAPEPIGLRCRGYRETRSVGMLVLDDREGRASRLAANIHGRLERLGVYEPERRPWLPHLTVIRFRTPPRLRPTIPDLGEFSPSGAAVYHSLLRRGGARYEVLDFVAFEASLGG
jgi:2'-5' RNA ligase